MRETYKVGTNESTKTIMTTKEDRLKWAEQMQGKYICACGCGHAIVITEHHYYVGIPKYIKYHNFRSGDNPMKNPDVVRLFSIRMKNDNPMMYPENVKKISGNNSPTKRPEVRKKNSDAQKARIGKNASRYVDGRHIKLRQWRAAVFKRDNYTCQKCNSADNLLAHHILKKEEYPEIKYLVENGITLCQTCHNKLAWHEEEYIPEFLNIVFHHTSALNRGSIDIRKDRGTQNG